MKTEAKQCTILVVGFIVGFTLVCVLSLTLLPK